jgi:hypothetical protein
MNFVDRSLTVADQPDNFEHDPSDAPAAVSQTAASTDPVVIDFNGNGTFVVQKTASAAAFDMNGDGIRDHTAWVESGDALLVYDAAGDNVIDQTAEVALTQYASRAATSLEAIRIAFDSNGDGFLSAADDGFANFKLWFDNGDGVSDPSELRSLSDMGIASINLTPNGDQIVYEDGSSINGIAQTSDGDGAVGPAAANVSFGYDPGIAQPGLPPVVELPPITGPAPVTPIDPTPTTVDPVSPPVIPSPDPGTPPDAGVIPVDGTPPVIVPTLPEPPAPPVVPQPPTMPVPEPPAPPAPVDVAPTPDIPPVVVIPGPGPSLPTTPPPDLQPTPTIPTVTLPTPGTGVAVETGLDTGLVFEWKALKGPVEVGIEVRLTADAGKLMEGKTWDAISKAFNEPNALSSAEGFATAMKSVAEQIDGKLAVRFYDDLQLSKAGGLSARLTYVVSAQELYNVITRFDVDKSLSPSQTYDLGVKPKLGDICSAFIGGRYNTADEGVSGVTGSLSCTVVKINDGQFAIKVTGGGAFGFKTKDWAAVIDSITEKVKDGVNATGDAIKSGADAMAEKVKGAIEGIKDYLGVNKFVPDHNDGTDDFLDTDDLDHFGGIDSTGLDGTDGHDLTLDFHVNEHGGFDLSRIDNGVVIDTIPDFISPESPVAPPSPVTPLPETPILETPVPETPAPVDSTPIDQPTLPIDPSPVDPIPTPLAPVDLTPSEPGPVDVIPTDTPVPTPEIPQPVDVPPIEVAPVEQPPVSPSPVDVPPVDIAPQPLPEAPPVVDVPAPTPIDYTPTPTDPAPDYSYTPPAPDYSYTPPAPDYSYTPPAPDYSYTPPAPDYSYAPPAPDYSYTSPAPDYSYTSPAPDYSYAPPAPDYSYTPPAPDYAYTPPAPDYSYTSPAPDYSYTPAAPDYSYTPPAPDYSYTPSVPDYSYSPPVDYGYTAPSFDYSYSSPPAFDFFS